MLQQGAWTFRYSLEGFLKRMLFVADQPQTEAQLMEKVLSDWAGPSERDSIANRVGVCLRAKNGAFRLLEEQRYVLRELHGDDLHNRAYRFVKDSGRPQKQVDILRDLQQVTGRGRGDLMSRIDLEADPRFVRLDGGGEWLLTEWELVNDAVADLMVELAQRQASHEDLLALLVEQPEFQGKTVIFLPELDPRFTVNGGLVDCLLVEEEAAATAEVEKTEVFNMETTTLEHTNNMQTPAEELVDTIVLQLSNALDELQNRNREIPNQVLELFNQDDLQGIESLMQQKKRLAALAEDLQGLVAKWAPGL